MKTKSFNKLAARLIEVRARKTETLTAYNECQRDLTSRGLLGGSLAVQIHLEMKLEKKIRKAWPDPSRKQVTVNLNGQTPFKLKLP